MALVCGAGVLLGVKQVGISAMGEMSEGISDYDELFSFHQLIFPSVSVRVF